jgi:hypothetical protein
VLHIFNDRRYRSVGLLPIGLAKLYTSERPICIKSAILA